MTFQPLSFDRSAQAAGRAVRACTAVRPRTVRLDWIAGIAVGLVAVWLVMAAPAARAVEPAAPQPAAEALQPGLAVDYYYSKFDSLWEFDDWMRWTEPQPGPALENIYFPDSRDTGVMTQGSSQLVGAHVRGFINFADVGTYTMYMLSNDGAAISIGGARVLVDDGVHAARWAEPREIAIDTPGWYPIEVKYFQKKGSAALELHWSKDGSERVPVPPAAFAHLP